jgi:hypothetical protein
MSKQTKEVGTVASQEVINQLSSAYPVEQSGLRIILPRISMASQDVTEGKGKAMKVVTEAGTFFIESETDEINEETGKKVWAKDEIGSSFEGIIIYKRKQLRYYDESNETYTSSPVYDNDDEIIPLFCNKKEVARGTPKELKAREEYAFEKDGKQKSKLEDNRILYVLKDGQLYQLGLRGSSMYSLMSYERSTNVPGVLTKFSSEPMEKGTICWNKMTFVAVRALNTDEAELATNEQKRIIAAVQIEKASYANKEASTKKADDELDEMVASATKQLGK